MTNDQNVIDFKLELMKDAAKWNFGEKSETRLHDQEIAGINIQGIKTTRQ